MSVSMGEGESIHFILVAVFFLLFFLQGKSRKLKKPFILLLLKTECQIRLLYYTIA